MIKLTLVVMMKWFLVCIIAIGYVESNYVGSITVYNRCPDVIEISLVENCVDYNHNGSTRMVDGSGGYITIGVNSQGILTLPDTVYWEKDYPLNNVLNFKYVKIDFINTPRVPLFFPCTYLNFGRSMDNGILVLKDGSVTNLSDANIDHSDYPDIYKPSPQSKITPEELEEIMGMIQDVKSEIPENEREIFEEWVKELLQDGIE